jgi:AP-1-like factor
MTEAHEKLTELQRQHHALTQSYETLQHQYSVVKKELESLRRQHENGSLIRNFSSCLREWDESGGESAGLVMFDASVFSVFCYDTEGDQD